MKTNSCVRYLPLFLLLSTGLMYAVRDSDSVITYPVEPARNVYNFKGDVTFVEDEGIKVHSKEDKQTLQQMLESLPLFIEIKKAEDKKSEEPVAKAKESTAVTLRDKLKETEEEKPTDATVIRQMLDNQNGASHLLNDAMQTFAKAFTLYAQFTQKAEVADEARIELESRQADYNEKLGEITENIDTCTKNIATRDEEIKELNESLKSIRATLPKKGWLF